MENTLVLIGGAFPLTCYIQSKKLQDKENNPEGRTKKCNTCVSIYRIIRLIIFSLVYFACSFLCLLTVEKSLRLRLHDKSGNFTVINLTISIFASVDTILKLIVQKICKYIIGEKMNVTASCYFYLFWVYNSFNSYLPVLFRIYLYGNTAGNPSEGYGKILLWVL